MKYASARSLLLAVGVTLSPIVAWNADAAPQEVYHLAIVNQAFVPDTLTIPAGQAVKIMVMNKDTMPAEFESTDLKRETVIPGKTELPVYVRSLEPGTYHFFNDFHPQSKGTLIVKKAGQ